MVTLQESAVFSATDYAAGIARAPDVKHPLLDKVRACSVNPEQAADFFLGVLHPTDTWRLSLNAAVHPYLHPTYVKMIAEFPLPKSHPFHWRKLRQAPTAESIVPQPGGSFTTD